MPFHLRWNRIEEKAWPEKRDLTWRGEPVLFDHVGRLLADHDGGRVGVAVDQVGHDGRVDDAQPLEAVDAQPGVDDGQRVRRRPHLGRAHRVVERGRVLAHETRPVLVRVHLFQFRISSAV